MNIGKIARLAVVASFGLYMAVNSTFAATQPSSEPQETSATYDDWVLQCRAMSNGNINSNEKARHRNCEIVQTLRSSGGGQSVGAVVAQLALGRLQTSGPLTLTAALPVELSLPGAASIHMAEDDKAPIILNWRKCFAQACFASAEILETEMVAFGTSKAPTIEWLSSNGQVIRIPISFKGFDRALGALNASDRQ